MNNTRNDYTLKIELFNGKIKQTSFQQIIKTLKVENELYEGQKLKYGYCPQVQGFISCLKEILEVKKITAIHQGIPVLSV